MHYDKSCLLLNIFSSDITKDFLQPFVQRHTKVFHHAAATKNTFCNKPCVYETTETSIICNRGVIVLFDKKLLVHMAYGT